MLYIMFLANGWKLSGFCSGGSRMKPVHFRKSRKVPISRALVSFLFTIVLVACGTSAVTTPSSPAQSYPSKTAKEPTNTALSLNLNSANLSVKAGDLLIQAGDGFQCPYDTGLHYSIDQLVLTSSRTTYSPDEIAQMKAYVGDPRTTTSTNTTSQGVLNGGTEPPPTLRWVLGGAISPIPGTSISSPCGAVLTLTNTGSTPIQIPKVGVQLKARPQQNSYQYRLIDVCSFLPQSQGQQENCAPTGGGGPGACSAYFATIQLGPGEQNAVFSALPSHEDPAYGIHCGTLTIAPAAQVQLYIDFSFAPNTPKSLIYSVLPTLTVDTAQGNQTLALSQLVSTLAFAGVSQFSCYGLQGTTFVLVKPSTSSPNWCI
jgi:hypothetical protein